jgi:hypothetical protein
MIQTRLKLARCWAAAAHSDEPPSKAGLQARPPPRLGGPEPPRESVVPIADAPGILSRFLLELSFYLGVHELLAHIYLSTFGRSCQGFLEVAWPPPKS